MDRHRGVDSSSVLGDEPSSWDCGRELRALRDAYARSRAEEANILRRSAEEVERCALRRHAEESAALHDFLSGFREALEVRMESQQSKLLGRLEALERRVDVEASRLESARTGLLADVRTALQNDLESGDGDWWRLMEKALTKLSASISAELGEMSRGLAQDIAKETVGAVSSQVSELQGDFDEARNSWARDSEKFGSGLSACHDKVEALASRMHAVDSAVTDVVTKSDAQGRTLLQVEDVVSKHQPLLFGLEAWQKATLARLDRLASIEEEPLRGRFGGVESLAVNARGLAERALSWMDATEKAMRSEESRLGGELRSELDDVEIFARQEAAESVTVYQCMRSELQTVRAETSSTANLLEVTEQGIVDRASLLDAEQAQRLEVALGGRLDASCERLLATQRALEYCEAEQALLARTLPEACARAESAAEDAAWRGPESQKLREELSEMRREAAATAASCKAASAEASQGLSAISAQCGRLAAELTHVQQQGLTHEWNISRIRERVQYLSIGSDAGVWLDSPEFGLGCLSDRLTLRLYPRGERDGDGLCAVGLHDSANSAGGRGGHGGGKHSPLPLRVNLSVQGLSRKAFASYDSSGGVLWLATGFGTLETLVGNEDSFVVSVEVPARSWGMADEASVPSPGALADISSISSKSAAESVAPSARIQADATALRTSRAAVADATAGLGSVDRASLETPAAALSVSSPSLAALRPRGIAEHGSPNPYSSNSAASPTSVPFGSTEAPRTQQRTGWALFGEGRGVQPARSRGVPEEPVDPHRPQRNPLAETLASNNPGPGGAPVPVPEAFGSNTPVGGVPSSPAAAAAAAAAAATAPKVLTPFSRSAPCSNPFSPAERQPLPSTNPFDK